MRRGITDAEISSLEARLRFEFKNRDLVRQAFVHKSYINEAPKGSPETKSYDRLEFLGDAVVSLAVANYFYGIRDEDEGSLTELRKDYVEEMAEAEAAERLGLDNYIVLGRGAEKEGRKNPRLMADCFEALIGAAFLDQGYDKAATAVVRLLIEDSPGIR
jgi:ribonuclease-3